MRKRLNLNDARLPELILIHGGAGAGKSHLAGDMLRTEREKGDVRYVDVYGEFGTGPLKNFALGDVAETVDAYEDLQAIQRELRAKPARAVVVDSIKSAERLIERALFGSDRAPRNTKETNESGILNRELENFLLRWRGCADLVLFTAPSDRSVDQVGDAKPMTTPDLPGRNAAGVAYAFDLVLNMRAEITGPKTVKRVLRTAPSPEYLSKARLPRPLPAEIDVSEMTGGWSKLWAAVEGTFKEGGGK